MVVKGFGGNKDCSLGGLRESVEAVGGVYSENGFEELGRIVW